MHSSHSWEDLSPLHPYLPLVLSSASAAFLALLAITLLWACCVNTRWLTALFSSHDKCVESFHEWSAVISTQDQRDIAAHPSPVVCECASCQQRCSALQCSAAHALVLRSFRPQAVRNPSKLESHALKVTGFPLSSPLLISHVLSAPTSMNDCELKWGARHRPVLATLSCLASCVSVALALSQQGNYVLRTQDTNVDRCLTSSSTVCLNGQSYSFHF